MQDGSGVLPFWRREAVASVSAVDRQKKKEADCFSLLRSVPVFLFWLSVPAPYQVAFSYPGGLAMSAKRVITSRCIF